LEPIVTHQLPMSEYERGFKLMQTGEGIKIVLQIPQVSE
jgi:Zn-dependent alcohol dehydrogenase